MALNWKIFTRRPYIQSLSLEEQIRLFNIANEKSIRLRESKFQDFANSNSTSQGSAGDGDTGVTPYTNTRSLNFDGTDDFVANGEKFNFVQETGIFSVSCWLKLDNYTSATLQSICHTNNGGRLQDGFWLFYDNRSVTGAAKRLGFYLYGGNDNASDLDLVAKENAFSDNNWHHVAVIGSSAGTYGTLTLYIDGSAAATRALLSNSLTTDAAYNNFTIGDYNSNHNFDGKIDEVAIWNSDQTSNISNIYNGGVPGDIASLNPQLWYRFEEGSGTTAIDAGSGGNNGTINGAVYTTDVPT
jgi:hypothetical protein